MVPAKPEAKTYKLTEGEGTVLLVPPRLRVTGSDIRIVHLIIVRGR